MLKSSEFVERLGKELEVLPEEERASALSFYEEYFSEAADEERAVIKLGTPEAVAKNIINEYYSQNATATSTSKKAKRKLSDTNKILLVIILVLLSPVIIPVAGAVMSVFVGALCVVFGLFVGAAAIIISLLVSGYAVALAGIVLAVISIFAFVGLSLADGLFILGTGIVLTTVGLMFGILMTWISVKIIPALISWFVDLCKLPFKMRRKSA